MTGSGSALAGRQPCTRIFAQAAHAQRLQGLFRRVMATHWGLTQIGGLGQLAVSPLVRVTV